MVTRRQGVLAFALQPNADTPCTAAQYVVPKVSGGIKDVPEYGDLPFTRPTSARAGRFKQRAYGGGTLTIPVFPDPIGLILYAVCGDQSVDGGGPPYIHHFSIAEPTDLPCLTMWDLVGNDWYRFMRTYVQGCTIRGASGDNCYAELNLVAFDYDVQSGPPSGYTDADIHDDEPRFKYIGSTVKVTPNSGTPVQVRNVNSTELAVNRTMDLGYGSELTPTDGVPAREVDFNIGAFYKSAESGWDFQHVSAAGPAASGASGLGPSQAVGLGSFDVKYGRHPSDATRYLQIASNGRNWEFMAERPDSDPAGGRIDYDVAGRVIDPGNGATEVNITLANDKSGVYAAGS